MALGPPGLWSLSRREGGPTEARNAWDTRHGPTTWPTELGNARGTSPRGCGRTDGVGDCVAAPPPPPPGTTAVQAPLSTATEPGWRDGDGHLLADDTRLQRGPRSLPAVASRRLGYDDRVSNFPRPRQPGRPRHPVTSARAGNTRCAYGQRRGGDTKATGRSVAFERQRQRGTLSRDGETAGRDLREPPKPRGFARRRGGRWSWPPEHTLPAGRQHFGKAPV